MKRNIQHYVVLILFLISSQIFSQEFNYELQAIHLEANSNEFTKITTADYQDLPSTNHFGIKNGNYWIKLTLTNSSIENSNFVLRLPSHNIGDVYMYSKETDYLKLIDSSAPLSNNLPHVKKNRFPAFQLKQQANSTNTYYINTFFTKDTNFPISIELEDDYYFGREKDKIISSLYYGLLLAVIMFNFFFYVHFKDNVYLFYLFWLISYNITSLTYDGYLGGTAIIDLEVINHILMQVTMLLFTYKFLNLSIHYPKFKRYAIIAVSTVVAFALLYLITKNYLFFTFIDIVDMICFTLVWILSISLLSKIDYAKFYILGFLLLYPFSIYLMLSYDFGVFSISSDSVTLKIGSAINMLIFTYAIIYRMDSITKEQRQTILDLKVYINNYDEQSLVAQSKNNGSLIFLLQENDFTNEVLTKREIDILECIIKEQTNSEIAKKLFISLNTVKYHTKNIYKKLGVHNRKETTEKLKNYMSKSY